MEHGYKLIYRMEAVGAVLHVAEHLLQPLHEGVGDPVNPVAMIPEE